MWHMPTTSNYIMRCPNCEHVIGTVTPRNALIENRYETIQPSASVESWLSRFNWQGRIASGDLYSRYAVWAEQRGEAAVSHRKFSMDLQALGVVLRKGSKGVRVFEWPHDASSSSDSRQMPR